MKPEHEFRRNSGFLWDLMQFLIQNKKWWIIPIAAVFLVMGLLIALGATSAAPFIYTLF